MNCHEEILKQFPLFDRINYDNREGGKYAYVQFMAYGRELMLSLGEAGFYAERQRLSAFCERMNEMLTESFTDQHRLYFRQAQEQVAAMAQYLGGLIKSVSRAA